MAGRSAKPAFSPARNSCILRGPEYPGRSIARVIDSVPVAADRRRQHLPAHAAGESSPGDGATASAAGRRGASSARRGDGRLSSYRGRPLIVNVWASWCSPCRKEAASLERLAWSEAGSRYTVIGISTDDDRNAALRWLRQSNATISHYIDSAPSWTLEHMLGASTIPVTVLVDAEGRVVARIRGARDWNSAESIQLIERALR
jgi:thiol-disulfide isomerase/thioredoxin